MVFNAAKDLVYTMNGGNISSGGYRISKIINGKSKKKGKQTQDGGGHSSIFKEDSGIPIGLLLMQQRFHFEDDGIANCKNKKKEERVTHCDENENENENKKLVYASIMKESDDDDDGRGIELVIMPSGIANPIEISSNEIDDEIYDFLIESVSGPEHSSTTTTTTTRVSTPLRKANATKKHKDIEKVYQKRKTRSKRHH